MLRVLAETGIRRAEVAALTTSDFNSEDRLLVIRCGKNGKQRVIPLTRETAGEIARFVGPKIETPLFASRKGGELTPRQVNRIVANAGIRAGISNPNPKYPTITPHLFRHTFARLWKSAGGSIETLSAILGHESTRTTWDAYGKEGLQDIRDNYDKLMARLSATDSKSRRRTISASS